MDESTLRLSFFLIILIVMVFSELISPRRKLQFGRQRWPANLGIIVLDLIVARLLFPAGAVGIAIWAEAQGFGLFNLLTLPAVLEVALAVILLDLAIYTQHVAFHAVPLLWRLHRVHHADREIDVSTGLRFHPIEMILSLLIKMAVVILLGVPVEAVIIFEIILNGMAMFNHANVCLPEKLDGIMRKLLITPDVHRIHHSVIEDETNSNYGFNLSIWDRLFGTYRAQPRLGHLAMTIGLKQLQQAPTHNLLFMLRLPFQGDLSQYPNSDKKQEQKHV